jgi:cyclophilin family peptidyl-prolyl cis-trans isomerase
MRLFHCLVWLGGLAATLALCAGEKMADGVYAEFTTPRGTFVVELNYREAPLTVANFVGLAEGTIAPRDGKPYYTGLKWSRVVPGFVIQSGNPRAPEDGDPGYAFPDEFVPGLRHAAAGVLSMANAGPDTNGGEFFLTLGDCTRLNYLHSVFGHVFTGLEVLPRIQADDPLSIRILRVGEAGRAFRADEATFKARAAQARRYTGTAEPGPAAHFDDPDRLLPTEVPRARNFNFKLANYERATGRRIVARLFAKSPPAAEDAVPGAWMRTLADKLGVAKTGVLVVYFADESDWRVWIGDDLVSDFLGRPATPADLAEGAAVHQAKEALFAQVEALAQSYTAQARTQRGPDQPLRPSDLIKYSTDAMLDTLLLRFEPRP